MKLLRWWRRDVVRARDGNSDGGAAVSCCGCCGRCTEAKEEAGDEMKAQGVTGGRKGG